MRRNKYPTQREDGTIEKETFADPVEQVQTAADDGISYINNLNCCLNIKAEPDPESKTIGTVMPRETVRVIDRSKVYNGNYYKCEAHYEQGIVGYIRTTGLAPT